MEVRTERVIAYCLAGIFFIVGIVCYAAFPEVPPDEPVRIMLKSTAGNILFDHKGHTSESGYAYDCDACHLHGDEDEPTACGECHEPESEDLIKRSDAFHDQCKGCHEDEELGPVKCAECHVM